MPERTLNAALERLLGNIGGVAGHLRHRRDGEDAVICECGARFTTDAERGARAALAAHVDLMRMLDSKSR